MSLRKKFSWYQPNGPEASKFDRILVSNDLLEVWGVKAQWIGDRDISDHWPIWLMPSMNNWGPKPFKFINGWLKHNDKKSYMEEKW